MRRNLVLPVAFLVPTLAVAGDPAFLHLTVQEKGYNEPNVKVNIPLSLIDVVADAIKDDDVVKIDGVLDDIEREGIDIRKLWTGLKDLGPTDFIEIENEDDHVKVWKDREAFRITITEKGQSEPKVLVTFPLAIVESVIGDGSQPITLKGIVAQLKKAGPMQFVEIHDEGEHVRIWLE